MKKILERLKSPVVIGQLLTNIAGIIVLLIPDKADLINEIVLTIMAIVNIFAGINNPTTSDKF